MSLQGPSGAGRSSNASDHFDDFDDAGDGLFAEINITPFTDVILVLLIIFMVSSSAMVDAAREGRLDVSLPQAGSAAAAAANLPTLVVGVAADGRVFVDGNVLAEEDLASLLKATHKRAPNTVVIIDADGHLEHRSVVAVIDRVRGAGFASVGIGTEAD